MVDPRVLWARLTDSLWFVPSVIVLAAVVLALAMVELSALVDPETLARYPRVFGAGAEGSRSMLAAIAGSMITVAGVTFSITMVAVTQASSQYTPRILRNFMRDRANQLVLGIFVGIFAYCLVVLRTIRGEEAEAFVPSLAVLLGVLLAIVGIGVLIFFVHHIATTLQASEIVARVMRETLAVMRRLYPDEAGGEEPDAELARVLSRVPAASWRPVPARETGYIQRTDLEGALRIACKAGLLLRMEPAVGEFVVAGLPTAWYARHPEAPGDEGAAADEALAGALAALIVVSPYRSIDQDPGFGIRQLVDIALKALSPGINDTTTAVTCVDYLGAILVCLAGRRVEIAGRHEGVVRVVTPRPTFEDLLDLAFAEIRRHAEGNVSILARQLETLALVAGAAPAGRRPAVLLQVELVQQAAATIASPHDRGRLDVLAQRARTAAS